jgi:hypothetical protein
MQTFRGMQFWPCDPRADEIFIEDIAHALSMQCRFGGHVRTFYSVAEHCWRLSAFCEDNQALWGLMHDAAEAYLVDLPRPLKDHSSLGSAYRSIEKQLMVSVCERFGLPIHEPDEVKHLDGFMLAWEQRDLMAVPPVPWKRANAFQLPVVIICPMSPGQAERAFLDRFYELCDATRQTELTA